MKITAISTAYNTFDLQELGITEQKWHSLEHDEKCGLLQGILKRKVDKMEFEVDDYIEKTNAKSKYP